MIVAVKSGADEHSQQVLIVHRIEGAGKTLPCVSPFRSMESCVLEATVLARDGQEARLACDGIGVWQKCVRGPKASLTRGAVRQDAAQVPHACAMQPAPRATPDGREATLDLHLGGERLAEEPAGDHAGECEEEPKEKARTYGAHAGIMTGRASGDHRIWAARNTATQLSRPAPKGLPKTARAAGPGR